MKDNRDCVNEERVPAEFTMKEVEWQSAKLLAADYIEAADTLSETIVKIALLKAMSREEKELAIDSLTRSIWVLMDMMAKDVLNKFND